MQHDIPMSFPLGRAWYVISCFAKNEFEIEREMIRVGFDAYVPKMRRRKVVAKRRVIIEQALFPGYVFVAFDVEREDWQELILPTPGVIDLLSNNRIPVRLRGEVEALQRAQAAGAFDYTVKNLSFGIGDTVQIKKDGSPMDTFFAKVKNANAKHRVEILLNFLGRQVTSTIEPCYLEKVA
jgi:transcriptional antiterminator RfaH